MVGLKPLEEGSRGRKAPNNSDDQGHLKGIKGWRAIRVRRWHNCRVDRIKGLGRNMSSSRDLSRALHPR
jgi:hypothetical protein